MVMKSLDQRGRSHGHVKHLMLGLCLASLAAMGGCVAAARVTPDKVAAQRAPDGRLASDPMFQFSGVWEGRIELFDAPRFADGTGHAINVRFVVSSDGVRVFTSKVTELHKPNFDWQEVKSGFFSIEQWGSQAVITSTTSGRDEDSLWVESSTYTLVHDTPKTLVVYWVRAVNNLDVPADNPEHHFAWGGSGQFHKVDDEDLSSESSMERVDKRVVAEPVPVCQPGHQGALFNGSVTLKPGDTICLTLAAKGASVVPVAVVDVADPRDTLVLRFWREGEPAGTYLTVQNPLETYLRYDASMLRAGALQREHTSSCPVLSRRKAVEQWPFAINELTLAAFAPEPETKQLSCR